MHNGMCIAHTNLYPKGIPRSILLTKMKVKIVIKHLLAKMKVKIVIKLK